MTQGPEERLARFIAEAREELRGRDPAAIGRLSGVEFDRNENAFFLKIYGKRYAVTYPDMVAREEGNYHHEGTPWLQSLVLHYFKCSDGSALTGDLVSFRDLPGGMFYEKAFQGYSGDLLSQAFGNDLERFERAAETAGGKRCAHGDAGYAFNVLPRVDLTVVYWLGEDDEIPPAGQVLFDAAAHHYLPTDALAGVGGRLCRLLLEADARNHGEVPEPHTHDH